MNNTRFLRSSLLVLGCMLSFKLALSLYISLDEFTYTHAAWLVSERNIPYKDFPLFHPPLLEFLLSPIFSFTNSGLTAILVSRAVFGLLLFIVALLVERESKSAIGFVLTICLGVFSTWMTEVRPDSLALLLFLLSYVSLSKNFTLLSGLLIGLGMFTSEKTLIYAPVLAVLPWAEKDFRKLMLLVISSIFFTILLYSALIFSAGFEPVKEFIFGWAVKHETLYPSRSPLTDIYENLPQLIFLITFATIALRRSLKSNLHWMTLLVLGALSFLSQRGPYGYSLLPTLLALLILSAQGINIVLANRLSKKVLEYGAIVVLFIFMILVPPKEVSNREQLNTLALADLLVSASSCIYDNSGFVVNRPSADYWYFTDGLIRNLYMSEFEIRVPAEIEENHCAAMIKDERFSRLSEKLRTELTEIFPRCMGMICFRNLGVRSH